MTPSRDTSSLHGRAHTSPTRPTRHVTQTWGPDLSRETTAESSSSSDMYTSSQDTGDDGPSSPLLKQSNAPRTLETTWWQHPTFILTQRPATPRKRTLRRRRTCSPRYSVRTLLDFLYVLLSALVAILLFVAVFCPSYTHLPEHYRRLAALVHISEEPGRGNLANQKIFIAASLYDPGGQLAAGPWGQNLLDLIFLLGPDNTYLSIYQNDAGLEAQDAMAILEQTVPCNKTFKFEAHAPFEAMPHLTLPDGTKRLRRVEYLARVRNEALKPLQDASIKFDKLIYLNDVFFDPVDILQLIFNTNSGNYRAACAVDFIDPFKFYDTFATRDVEGYGMGFIIFPWFSSAGNAQSRRQVLDGSDAVQVKSCWGGVTAFDARYFQPSDSLQETAGSSGPLNLTAPYSFRAADELFWDASECCLIQADIQSTDPNDSGIYMNPFVRVAYGARTLSWLGLIRRFERAYTPLQLLLSVIIGLPTYNARQQARSWDETTESFWVANPDLPANGSFQELARIATHDGFCGVRKLMVIKEHDLLKEKPWENLPIPGGRDV